MTDSSSDTLFGDSWGQIFMLLAIVSGLFSAQFYIERGAPRFTLKNLRWDRALELFGSCRPQAPGRWAVGASGCSTLSAALSMAKDGDEIALAPGVYREGLEISRSVALIGSGAPGSSLIEYSGRRTLSISGGHVQLRNVAIANTGAGGDWAIAISDARLTMANVVVRSDGGGVRAVDSDLDVSETSLEGRTAFSIEGRSQVRFGNGRISGSEAGIRISGENTQLTLSKAEVTGSRAAGLDASRFAVVRIEDSWLTENSVAATIHSGADVRIDRSTLAKNKNCALLINAGSATLNRTLVSESRCGAGFSGSGTLQVDASRFTRLSGPALEIPGGLENKVTFRGSGNVGLGAARTETANAAEVP